LLGDAVPKFKGVTAPMAVSHVEPLAFVLVRNETAVAHIRYLPVVG